jgi:hypothetical protein
MMHKRLSLWVLPFTGEPNFTRHFSKVVLNPSASECLRIPMKVQAPEQARWLKWLKW